MKFFIITSELGYLAYSHRRIGYDTDGYFWTTFDIMKDCLNENNDPHRFAFNADKTARKFAENMFSNINWEIKEVKV